MPASETTTAMRATVVRLPPALRLDARASTGGGRTWLRRSLVVIDVALAILLVTGATLMVRSFARLLAVTPASAQKACC